MGNMKIDNEEDKSPKPDPVKKHVSPTKKQEDDL
jgi:hypothetical protein